MDMLWNTKVRSRFRVNVPNVVILTPSKALKTWIAAKTQRGWKLESKTIPSGRVSLVG